MPRYVNSKRIESIKVPPILGLFSGRMTGKSVGTLHNIAARCFLNEKEFIYLDLTDEPANTLDRRENFFSKVNLIDWSTSDNYPEFNEKVYYWNRKFYVITEWDKRLNLPQNVKAHGQCIGRYKILEEENGMKSVEYPNVQMFLIDEFSDKIKKYSNFEHDLVHYVSTICRDRDDCQLLLLGNAADARNPLLNRLGIGGNQLKKYIDKRPYYDGYVYLEFFTMKGLRANVFEKFWGNDLEEPIYPKNEAGDDRHFAEKIGYILGVDLDSVDIEEDSTFTADNINKEYRDHVDLLVEGKGECLGFKRLAKTLLVQSTKPKSYDKKIWMDSTLNKSFENEWLQRYLQYPNAKIFEDANAKIKFIDLGGK